MKRKIHILLLILTSLLTLSSCKPASEPKQFVEDYYNNILQNNFSEAYNMLCAQSKINYPEEDFILYQQLLNEAYNFTDFSVQQISKTTNKYIEGINYKNAAEFTVTQTALNLYTNSQETNTYTVYAVAENGEWKIHQGSAFHQLSLIYFNARDYKYDYNQSAEQANAEPNNNFYKYYERALAHIALDMYEEAQAEIAVSINSAENNNQLSDAYNVKGLCYMGLEDYSKAKAMFTKSLKLNPANTYAETNLNRVK